VDDKLGPPAKGLADEAVAVDLEARNGNKKTPGSALPGVVADAAHIPGKVPRDLPYLHTLKHIGKEHPFTITDPD
jgi:hypothetical protein